MKILLSAILLLTNWLAFSQKKVQDTSEYLQQSGRIEFPLETYRDEYHIINGQDRGLLVIRKTQNINNYRDRWILYKLDTNLHNQWHKNFIVPEEYIFLGWDYSKGYYYMLFASDQYRRQDLSVFKISDIDGTQEEVEITTVFPIFLTHFEAINNVIMLAGSANYRPVILTFDLDERKPRVIPGIYEKNVQITNIKMDRKKEVFTVSMIEQLRNRQFIARFKTYTMDNLMIQNKMIDPADLRNLIEGAATNFENGLQYVAGTYSKKSRQYSQGLYLAKFINGQQKFVKYYSYDDLTNFFEYMNDNREIRIRNRIEKKKQKGKTSHLSYRLKIHDIIQKNNENILIGEAYYPRYSNYSPYGSSGNYSGYSNIIGYKYTHTIVVSFDSNGNILWDHSFPLDNVFRYQEEEIVTINTYDNRIELLYLDKNLIRSKLVVSDTVIEGKTYTPIQLTHSMENVLNKNPDVEGLEKWYDYFFYAYGEQQIGIKNQFLIDKRRVFYINKIYYDIDNIIN